MFVPTIPVNLMTLSLMEKALLEDDTAAQVVLEELFEQELEKLR